jgi:hypothetical protein
VTVYSRTWFSHLKLATTVVAILAVVALLATIGADSRWLAALGHSIASTGRIPSGVPFAAAPSSHWTNAIVLSELIFSTLEHALGDRGLLLAQLIAVGIALAVLARDALAGGAEVRGVRRALVTAVIGALAAIVIVRVQLFSLALFPILCALLRSDARNPSRRIWLVVPLLALWANLHGAVLLGLGVTLAYLGLVKLRQRPRTAAALAIAATAALCLTPALLGTIGYYHGLLTNVAAARGVGMWGAPSPSSALDLAMIAAAIVLAFWARRARPAGWELAVTIALAAMTVQAARNGVWLVLFLAPIAARAAVPERREWSGTVPAVALAAVALLCFAFARGPVAHGANPGMVTRAIALAHGSPVLASNGIEEQVALAGGRIWAGDPLDAFSNTVQSSYLDFVQGTVAGRSALAAEVNVVLVPRGSDAQRLMAQTAGFRLARQDNSASLYLRRTLLPAV